MTKLTPSLRWLIEDSMGNPIPPPRAKTIPDPDNSPALGGQRSDDSPMLSKNVPKCDLCGSPYLWNADLEQWGHVHLDFYVDSQTVGRIRLFTKQHVDSPTIRHVARELLLE